MQLKVPPPLPSPPARRRYVYQRQYESGGQMWPLVAHKVVGCAFIMVVFTAVVLIFKAAYTQAAIMLVTLPLYLLRFDM